MLMLMQLGFRDALSSPALPGFTSALAATSSSSAPYIQYIIFSKSFTVRRLHQALALESVESVAPLYIGFTNWMSPDTHLERSVLVLGVDPNASALALPGSQRILQIQTLDTVLFDMKSRREFGPIEEQFLKEWHGHHGEVRRSAKSESTGPFQVGSSFGRNGTSSPVTHLSSPVLPHRKSGLIDIGVVKLKPGVGPGKVGAQLLKLLPEDVKVDYPLKSSSISSTGPGNRTRRSDSFSHWCGQNRGLIVGAAI